MHADLHHDTHAGIGLGGAFGGVIGLFFALGVGLALLAFAAAFGFGATAEAGAQDATSAFGALLVAALPFLAAPLVALGAGGWAGHATRGAGRGLVAGALGSVLGTVVLILVVGLGFLLGGAAAGTNVQVTVPEGFLPPGLQATLGWLATISGLLYILAVAVIGGLAGAVVGAVMPRETEVVEPVYDRRPVV